jgi:hypothetical protein
LPHVARKLPPEVDRRPVSACGLSTPFDCAAACEGAPLAGSQPWGWRRGGRGLGAYAQAVGQDGGGDHLVLRDFGHHLLVGGLRACPVVPGVRDQFASPPASSEHAGMTTVARLVHDGDCRAPQQAKPALISGASAGICPCEGTPLAPSTPDTTPNRVASVRGHLRLRKSPPRCVPSHSLRENPVWTPIPRIRHARPR